MLKMYEIGINYQQFFFKLRLKKLHSSTKVKVSIQLLKYLMTNTSLMQQKNRESTFHIPAELEHVQHVLEKLIQVVLINQIKVS